MADRKLISDSRAFRKECILFGFLLVFLTWIMFYVFLYKKMANCTVGFSVYGGLCTTYSDDALFLKGAITSRQSTRISEDRMSNIILCLHVSCSEIMEFSRGSDWIFAYNIESVLALLGFLMLLTALQND